MVNRTEIGLGPNLSLEGIFLRLRRCTRLRLIMPLLIIVFVEIFIRIGMTLTLFRRAFSGLITDGEGTKNAPLPKICHGYSTMMKLGTIIPYLKKIQTIYESRGTPSEFC